MMTDQASKKVFTLRETNARIRAIVERETVGKPFWTGGVVRNYYISDLGHEYFVLDDTECSIRCMIREPVRGNFTFTVANGMELEVLGTIEVYEKSAQIELQVEDVRWIDSVLPVLNEDVKERLVKRGLWPKERRAIPREINRIGIVTSKHGEALRDFEDTYRERGGTARHILEDVRIQGQQAPREIADAINRLNQQTGEDRVDVIVLTRGGGRSADLAVFSDCLVAEAICRSEIPVVTGIGHKSDKTFADHAADLETITPTAAAVRLAEGPQKDEMPHPLRRIGFIAIGAGLTLFVVILFLLLLWMIAG